MKTIDPKYQGK
jgi:hypothetical protein